jgi:hypothetical protein
MRTPFREESNQICPSEAIDRPEAFLTKHLNGIIQISIIDYWETPMTVPLRFTSKKLIFFMLLSNFSCQQRTKPQQAQLQTNGTVTSRYPFIRRVDRRMPNGQTRASTALFLVGGMALVAAHSVDPSQPSCGVTVEGFTPYACKIHPNFNKSDRSEQGAVYDIAVLFFGGSQATNQLSGMNKENIHLGGFKYGQSRVDAEFFGFGSRWNQDANSNSSSRSTIEGDHSGIEGDHTGIEGDHSGIEGDLYSIEGDHSGIEGDHTGIDSSTRSTDGKKRSCPLSLTRTLTNQELRQPGSGIIGIDYLSWDLTQDSRTCTPSFGDSGGALINDGQLIATASRIEIKNNRISGVIFVPTTHRDRLEFIKQQAMFHSRNSQSNRR